MSRSSSLRSSYLPLVAGTALLTLAFTFSAPVDSAAVLTSLAALLALLVPIGLALIAGGGLRDQRAGQTVLMALVALCLASISYLLIGFALQFGGIGLVAGTPGLERLVWEWSPFDRDWGLGWGVIGLAGFALGPEAGHPDAYLLFLSQLAPLSVAVLLPLLALRGRVRAPALAAGSLFLGGVVYPIAGNWLWGGGWLANLGLNLGLGHGYIDFAGASTAHLIGAVTALAGLLVFLPPRPPALPARMPPVHLPTLAVLGAFFVIPGWLALALANPLVAGAHIAWPVVAVNLVLSATGGALLAVLYAWFTTGSGNILMTVRGLVAGLVAISAAAPFVPAWAALFIGGVAGLLLPFFAYLLTHGLRLDDEALIVPVHGLAGLWGGIAVGLFADGSYGAGWNGVGLEQYLGVGGQGVGGLIVQSRFLPDFPGQLYAQCIGLAALAVLAFLIAWLVFKGLAHFALAWEGVAGEAPQPTEGEGSFARLAIPTVLEERPPAS